MNKGGQFLQKHTSAGKQRPKTSVIVLLTLAVLLLICVVLAAVFYNSILGNIRRAEVVEKDYTMNEELEQMMGVIEETTIPETTAEATAPTTLPYTPSNQNIVNILLIGQAAREGEQYRMADTMILLTVNKDTKTLTATSFLRDTYVKLPDYMGHTCGRNRINVCYHLGYTWGDTGGAMEMTSICLQNNFGIEVDHCVEVDFNAFTKIIDMLGGVEINLTEAEAKYMNEVEANLTKKWKDKSKVQHFEAGMTVLDGDHALHYARMRKADGDADSDIKRTSRQRYMLEVLLNKVKNDGFDKLKEIAETVLPMITTDMTNDEITTCIWELLPLLPELKFETGTCPVADSCWGEVIDILGVQSSVIKYDEYTNRRAMMALTEGITD